MQFYVKIFLIVLVAIYREPYCYAQDTNAWSQHCILPELTAWVQYAQPTEQIEQVIREEGGSVLKAWVYAVGIETAFAPHNSGQWDTVPGKGCVWRLGIRAAHAHSLNIFVENFKSQDGTMLFVHGNQSGSMAGPFDVRYNVNGGVLPVQSLPGDALIVEWNVPFAEMQKIIPFTITSVGYGFRDAHTKMQPAAAASCNTDVNSRTGNHWQREKRAVVRLETTVRTGGRISTQFCSGTLINQAVDAQHKKNYVLTACHCVSNAEEARNTAFVFNYEKPYANGSAQVAVPAGIAGATLVAAKRELDFALLEMNLAPTPAHRPYYAGWNATAAIPQSVIGIHHPQGDVKKISVERQPPATATFSDEATNLQCDPNAHWLVRRWDEGVTEGGSSGSPIFSNNNHQLVGTLSGGTAECGSPINDYYSKFSEQWNRYPADTTCLSAWLDPDAKGITTLWGYDPIAPFEGPCDTLGNIGKNETLTVIESDEWGYLTGQNDQQWIGFAEKFRNDSVASIIGMEVYTANISKRGAKVRFAVWGGSSNFPTTPLYTKDTTITADFSHYPMQIYFNRKIDVQGDYFAGYTVQYAAPRDTFTVCQSAVRPYGGLSGMYVEENNGLWMALADYTPPIYSSLAIRMLGNFSQFVEPASTTAATLKVVFHPSDNTVTVNFENPPENQATAIVIECYDIAGRRLYLREMSRQMIMLDGRASLQVDLNADRLPTGIYLIRALSRSKKLSGKFLVF